MSVLSPRHSRVAGLRILSGVTLYTVGAWLLTVLISILFALDAPQREGLLVLSLVVLLTAGWWQWASRANIGPQGTHGAMTVRLEADGLHMATRGYDVRCAREAVDRIVVEKDHPVLVYLGGRGVAIPTEAFGGDAGLRHFLTAASSLKSGGAPRN